MVVDSKLGRCVVIAQFEDVFPVQATQDLERALAKGGIRAALARVFSWMQRSACGKRNLNATF